MDLMKLQLEKNQKDAEEQQDSQKNCMINQLKDENRKLHSKVNLKNDAL